jgi:hypothetical protein
MAQFETSFGDIRSLAQRPADPGTWRLFMSALERTRLGDAATSEYAREVARRWPDALRVAPAHMVREMESGRAPRWLHLARAVTLTPETSQWIGRTALSSFTHLTYDACWGEAEGVVRRVLSASFMRGLRSLTVARAGDGPRVALALGEEPWPEPLTEVALRPARLGFLGAQALVEGSGFARLGALALDDPRCGVAGARLILGAHERAPALRSLSLMGTAGFALGDAGARALAELAPESLRELALCRHGISDAGASALATSALAARLERLDLRDNLIGDAGARALSRALRGGLRLDLSGNRVGSRGAHALRSSLSGGASVALERNPVWRSRR